MDGGSGGRVRRTTSSLVNGLAVRMAMRPRRAFAGLAVLVLGVMALTPATPAAADSGCGPSWISWACSIGGTILFPGLGTLVSTSDSAMKTVDALSPTNILDTWDQGLCHAVIFVLTFIESSAEKIGTPAFNQAWWADQYAVTFGLSLVILAFMLLIVTAKIGGGSGSSVSGVELLRQGGTRLVFVVPACAFAPALMYSVQQLAAGLTKDFATQAAVQANGAVGSFLEMMEKDAGHGWAGFGGSVMVMVLMIPILCCGAVLLVEMAVANWGMMICGLLVPLVVVAAVYPPWARALRRLVGIIVGLMFMPVVVFFFFWTVWSSMNGLFQKNSSNSPVTICVFLLVSLFMIDIFPVVCVWLLSIVAPSAETMPGDVRAGAPNPSPGDVYDGSFDKLYKGGGSGSEGTEGADGDGGDDGDEGEDGDDGDEGAPESSDESSKGGGGDDGGDSHAPRAPGGDLGSGSGDGGDDGGGGGGGGMPGGGGGGGGGEGGGGAGEAGGASIEDVAVVAAV